MSRRFDPAPSPRPGRVIFADTSPETARALLAAARRLGLDASMAVRTREYGFEVPDAVAEELANAPDVGTAKPTPGAAPSTSELVVDAGPRADFDPQKAGYNELKAEAARRFGPGGGSGSKEQLIAKLTPSSQPQEG